MGVSTAARIAAVAAVAAGLLVPGWVTPVEAVTFPEVMAASVTAPGRGEVIPRFEPTHIAFTWAGPEGSGVSFRTTGPGGRAGPWRRVPEAHDLEDGDVHYSGVVAVARPRLVQWRPVAGAASITADYLNTIDGPRRSRLVPATAEAKPSTPDVITRAQWGADESLKSTTGGCKRQFHPLQQAIVHHTAGANYDSRARATMRAIYWFHTVRRGWCDIGYNFVIGWKGQVFEGRWARRYDPWETHTSENRRGRVVAGAHTAGYNSGSVGISLMGNFSTATPSPASRRSLAELLAWEVDRHGLRPRGRHTYVNPETGLRDRLPYIAGHRQAGQTDCPGDRLFAALPGIRRDTKAVIGDGKIPTTVDLETATSKVDYGDSALFAGRLAADDGTGLAGRNVSLYRRNGKGRWRFATKLSTGPDGAFSHTFELTRNVKVRAFYFGGRNYWGSQSPAASVRVRPDVTLEAEGGVPDVAGVSHYPAGTTEVVLAGEVRPPHAGHQVSVRVFSTGLEDVRIVSARVALDDSGAYRFSFAPPGSGMYRARTHFLADGDHARSRSPDVYFVVDDG